MSLFRPGIDRLPNDRFHRSLAAEGERDRCAKLVRDELSKLHRSQRELVNREGLDSEAVRKSMLIAQIIGDLLRSLLFKIENPNHVN